MIYVVFVFYVRCILTYNRERKVCLEHYTMPLFLLVEELYVVNVFRFHYADHASSSALLNTLPFCVFIWLRTISFVALIWLSTLPLVWSYISKYL